MKPSQLALLVVGALFFHFPAHAKLRKWNTKMQELSSSLSSLLPDVVSQKPPTPATLSRMKKNTKQLLSLAHTINMGSGKANPLPPEADPTLSFVASLFERDVKQAYRSLEGGDVNYAKNLLRNVSGYCISCHSRHDQGPDFPSINLTPQSAGLSAYEKAELLAATRHFDAALDAFEKLAQDPKQMNTRQLEWSRALRNGLTLAVRAKNDPERAQKLVDMVSSMQGIPLFAKENLNAWKKSIDEWKKEQKRTANTEEGFFQEAVRLSTAAKALQKYPLDHSADVLYLRASAVVHLLLAQYPNSKRSAEALLLAGNAYDLLEDRLISPLPEMYYEACVRQSPHSPVALRCFQRFEENVYFGYTGSGGTFIPNDKQSLLEELKKLAS